MLKKALIAAAVAAFIPVAAANAAPAFHNPAPSHSQIAYHNNHGPKIVYKTVFQTKRIVTVQKIHGRFVKVVKTVRVPVKVAFINGRPVRM